MSRCLLLLAAAVVCAPGAAAQTDSPDAYYFAWRDAREALRTRDFTTAFRLLEALARETPDNADVWLALADGYTRAARAREALDAGRRAIALGARTAPWFIAYRIAGTFGRMGRRDSALVWLERALDLGWGDRPRIRSAEFFESLHGNERFARLAGALPSHPLDRVAGWRFDIAYFAEEVRRLHTGPSLPDLPPSFEPAIADLGSRVPELGDDAILLELQRVVSTLGDGHSWITSSGAEPSANADVRFDTSRLPLRFYLFHDGLFVVRATPEHRRWVGSRVVLIGSLSPEEAIEAITPYIARDNRSGIKVAAPGLLRSLVHLQAIGATDTTATVTLTLETPAGERHTVGFEGGAWNLPSRLGVPDSDRPVPLHLQRQDENYWVTALPDHDAVYMQFGRVLNGNGIPTLARFPAVLRDTLEATGARNLIIDVRYNGGGNNTLLRPLVRLLVWWEMGADDRRIYVITGRRTFSAAQNFVNRVERWTNAVIAGEPGGSRPNFVGETSRLVLPYSGLRGSISNRFWQDSDSGDLRQWIAPHIPTGLSSADHFTNRDPVMEAIFRVIDAERAAAP